MSLPAHAMDHHPVPQSGAAPAADQRAPWGLMAEFATADELLAAARAAREAGYTHIEA